MRTEATAALLPLCTRHATGIDSFADLVAAATRPKTGSNIAFNGSDTFVLLLDRVALADLSADDVVFV